MAKSHTKDELGRFLVDLALLKVDNWTRRQVDKMRHSGSFPICVPLGKQSWIIGPYHLHEVSEHQCTITLDTKLIHVFYSKQAAIFYSVLSRSKNQHYAKLARHLLIDDQIAGKLFDELAQLELAAVNPILPPAELAKKGGLFTRVKFIFPFKSYQVFPVPG